MNMEREAMKGQLVGLKVERQKLRLSAEGLAMAIRQRLNTALVDIEEINIPMVGQQMDDLQMTMAELAAINGKIARLEQELG